MTPDDIATAARQQYNAVTDAFFTPSELYTLIWSAEMILAREAKVIEQTYSTTTVASQQTYSVPTNSIAIKRITYDGAKLQPITPREDDAITLSNEATTTIGTPQYWYLWGRTIYLRSVPDSALTLEIFSFDAPAQVSASSVLEVPTLYHLDIVDFLLWRMAAKDKNFDAAAYYKDLWDDAVRRAIVTQKLQKRADGFVGVQDIEILPTSTSVIGVV